MKFSEWRKKGWYRHIIFALTVLLIVALASHPELRLLLPVVDSLGLDLLLLLITAQFMDYARPLLNSTFRLAIVPVAEKCFSFVIYFLGIMGPFVEARVSAYRVCSRTGA